MTPKSFWYERDSSSHWRAATRDELETYTRLLDSTLKNGSARYQKQFENNLGFSFYSQKIPVQENQPNQDPGGGKDSARFIAKGREEISIVTSHLMCRDKKGKNGQDTGIFHERHEQIK